jgi:hypothetical protein
MFLQIFTIAYMLYLHMYGEGAEIQHPKPPEQVLDHKQLIRL